MRHPYSCFEENPRFSESSRTRHPNQTEASRAGSQVQTFMNYDAEPNTGFGSSRAIFGSSRAIFGSSRANCKVVSPTRSPRVYFDSPRMRPIAHQPGNSCRTYGNEEIPWETVYNAKFSNRTHYTEPKTFQNQRTYQEVAKEMPTQSGRILSQPLKTHVNPRFFPFAAKQSSGPSEETGCFSKGDQVWVHNHGTPWAQGEVECVLPLRVRPLGWYQAHQWDEVISDSQFRRLKMNANVRGKKKQLIRSTFKKLEGLLVETGVKHTHQCHGPLVLRACVRSRVQFEGILPTMSSLITKDLIIEVGMPVKWEFKHRTLMLFVKPKSEESIAKIRQEFVEQAKIDVQRISDLNLRRKKFESTESEYTQPPLKEQLKKFPNGNTGIARIEKFFPDANAANDETAALISKTDQVKCAEEETSQLSDVSESRTLEETPKFNLGLSSVLKLMIWLLSCSAFCFMACAIVMMICEASFNVGQFISRTNTNSKL